AIAGGGRTRSGASGGRDFAARLSVRAFWRTASRNCRLRSGGHVRGAALSRIGEETDRVGTREKRVGAAVRSGTDFAERNRYRGLELLFWRGRGRNVFRWETLYAGDETRAGSFGIRDVCGSRSAGSNSRGRASAHRLEFVAQGGDGDAQEHLRRGRRGAFSGENDGLARRRESGERGGDGRWTGAFGGGGGSGAGPFRWGGEA